jgi:hypothetical protein
MNVSYPIFRWEQPIIGSLRVNTIELQDLRLPHPQLVTKSGNTDACNPGNLLSFESAATPSSCSTPWRLTGATIPNSARWARMALITEVC